MYQNPSYQEPMEPDLQTLLDAFRRDILKNLNCAKIGVIQDWDATDNTVTVQVAFQQVTSIAPDGTQTIASYPLLLKVPVHFPAGGDFTLTFPLAQGDECLVVFNDRQIDNWFAAGAGKPPVVGRTHDISDGIAFVGIRNSMRSLSDISTSTTQLRSNDGTTYVEVAGGGVVNVVAPTEITLTAPQVTITASTGVTVDTPAETITGVLDVQNENSESVPCTINGDIHATGDIVAGDGTSNISLKSHVHGGVQTGGGDTGPPL